MIWLQICYSLCLLFKSCEYSDLIWCEYQPIAFSRLLTQTSWAQYLFVLRGCFASAHWWWLYFTATNTGRRQRAVYLPEMLSTCCKWPPAEESLFWCCWAVSNVRVLFSSNVLCNCSNNRHNVNCREPSGKQQSRRRAERDQKEDFSL